METILAVFASTDGDQQKGSPSYTRWMETYVATNCTIRTEIGYQGNIDRYIVPAGGGSGSAVYYQSWQ